MNFFGIFNYFKMVKTLEGKFPTHGHTFSLIFALFSGTLLIALYRSLMVGFYNVEWSSISAQPDEVTLFDSIVIFKFIVACGLWLKLKEKFLQYYLTLYPSIFLSSMFLSNVCYLLVVVLNSYFHLQIGRVGVIFIWLGPSFVLYLILYVFPLKMIPKLVN